MKTEGASRTEGVTTTEFQHEGDSTAHGESGDIPPFDEALYAGEMADDLRENLLLIIEIYDEIPSWKMGEFAPKMRKLVSVIKKLDAVSPYDFLPR